MDYKKIGDFLRELRKSRKLTQQELSERFYISREAISKWERGISLPDYPSLIALSKFYNITINEILVGEKLDEHNKERIDAVALTILESSEKEIRKNKIRTVIILMIAIMIILFLYFIDNYNSIQIYTIEGYNDDFYITSGEIFVSRNEIYLNIGMIHDKDGNIITKDDNYEIIVYYNKDNKRILCKTNDIENIYLRLYDFKDMLKDVKKEDLLDNLYIEFKREDLISTIKLERKLFYRNDYKLYLIPNGKFSYIKTKDKVDIKEDAKEIMLDNKKYYYRVTDDEIELISEDDITISYVINLGVINIYEEDNMIVYSYERDECVMGDCERYDSLIRDIKNELLKEFGLN